MFKTIAGYLIVISAFLLSAAMSWLYFVQPFDRTMLLFSYLLSAALILPGAALVTDALGRHPGRGK